MPTLLTDPPHCPLFVTNAIIADTIRAQCVQFKIPIPPEIKEFITAQVPNAGFDWQLMIVRELQTEPKATKQQWLNVLPSPLYRSQLRAMIQNE